MTDQQPPAEMPPANEPPQPAEMQADMPAPPEAPQPMMAAEAPASATPPAPSGWVQPSAAAPVAPGRWVAPAASAQRGSVSGLAKLGAFVLILFGVLWSLLGLLMILAGGVIRDLLGTRVVGGVDYASLAGGLVLGFGIVILLIALLEIFTGVFAWRGSGFARFIGIVYGLVFGLGSLALGLQRPGADVSRVQQGQVVLIVFAVLYLYVAIVFMIRWRSRA